MMEIKRVKLGECFPTNANFHRNDRILVETDWRELQGRNHVIPSCHECYMSQGLVTRTVDKPTNPTETAIANIAFQLQRLLLSYCVYRIRLHSQSTPWSVPEANDIQEVCCAATMRMTSVGGLRHLVRPQLARRRRSVKRHFFASVEGQYHSHERK